MRHRYSAGVVSGLLACSAQASPTLLGTEFLFECAQCTPSISEQFVGVTGAADYRLRFDGYVWYEVDVEASTISMRSVVGGFTRSPLAFKISWSPDEYKAIGLTLASASTFEPSYTWGAGELIVDMGALSLAPGDRVIFNVTAAPVPEPAQWSILLLGGVALLSMRQLVKSERRSAS